MTANVLDHLAGQRIAFICGFADRFYRAVIEGDFALITLLQQMTNAMFNGGVGGDGFQTAEVAAVAALAQRVDLDMADFPDVTVTANKNPPVGDDPCAGPTVYAHQNGVFTVVARTKVVLRQRQATNIVPDIASDFKAFFQRFNQPPVLHLNMRHIANDAAFRIDQPRQDHRNGD